MISKSLFFSAAMALTCSLGFSQDKKQQDITKQTQSARKQQDHDAIPHKPVFQASNFDRRIAHQTQCDFGVGTES